VEWPVGKPHHHDERGEVGVRLVVPRLEHARLELMSPPLAELELAPRWIPERPHVGLHDERDLEQARLAGDRQQAVDDHLSLVCCQSSSRHGEEVEVASRSEAAERH
jgi:hypothetical protein